MPSVFIDVLYARYPEILAMREFANHEALENIPTGTGIWETTSSCGRPVGVSYQGVLLRYETTDIGIKLIYSEPDNYGYLRDYQNALCKAVFTSLERAEEYYNVCNEAYAKDVGWQANTRYEVDQLDDFSDYEYCYYYEDYYDWPEDMDNLPDLDFSRDCADDIHADVIDIIDDAPIKMVHYEPKNNTAMFDAFRAAMFKTTENK